MQCNPIPTQKPLVYGSVCSGIEAATAAWHQLGWKPAFFSEIEPFPRTVLAHHYPHVPLHGDFTTIKEDDYDPIDLLVGGTPCQAFSVAGLRKGFADERGNLTLEYIRLAERLKPRWLVWENVPGVLSQDRGRAFGSFLGGLAECGYGFAYRVLDAQYFGVPQRRRRVFVIGYLGDWRPPAAVLFERESLCGNITPSRESRKSVAPALRASAAHRGGIQDDSGANGLICADVAPTLNAAFGNKLGLENQHIDGGAGMFVTSTPTCNAKSITGTVSSKWAKGTGGPAGDEHYNLIAFDAAQITSKTNRSNPQPGDPCHTLHQKASHHVACFKGGQGSKAGSIGYDEHLSPTLNAADSGSNRTPTLMQSSSVRRLTPRECERLQGFTDDFTLVPYGRPTRTKLAADFVKYLMRGGKLTEAECHGRAADGPRYKAIGNSMAVPVMRWIGERISEVDTELAA